MKKKPTLEERKQELDTAFRDLGAAFRDLGRMIYKELNKKALKIYLKLKKVNRGFKK